MSWFKLLQHDLRCGILRWRYVTAALLALFPCLEFLYSANIIGVSPSWMDYLLLTFKGMIPVQASGPMDNVTLPFSWLLVMGACLFVNLDYLLMDLTNNGQQVMIRSWSRHDWFLSKCVWNLAATAVYFLCIGLVELVFVVVTGGQISPENTKECYLGIFGLAAFEPVQLPLWQGLMLGLLLPYLTLAALSMLQMTLCLVVKPVVSFLVCMALLVLAVYVDSPFALGNGAMTIRSSIVASDGQDPIVAVLTAIGIITVCMIVGTVVFKHSDVLGSKE